MSDQPAPNSPEDSRVDSLTHCYASKTLNRREALYLKGLMQNPLCDPADEDSDTKDLRRKLWDALNEVNFIVR